MSWLDAPIFGTLTVEKLILFLLIVAIGALIGRIAHNLVRRALDDRAGRRMSKVIARLVMYSILIVATSIAFSQVLQQELTGLIISLVLAASVAFWQAPILGLFTHDRALLGMAAAVWRLAIKAIGEPAKCSAVGMP